MKGIAFFVLALCLLPSCSRIPFTGTAVEDYRRADTALAAEIPVTVGIVNGLYRRDTVTPPAFSVLVGEDVVCSLAWSVDSADYSEGSRLYGGIRETFSLPDAGFGRHRLKVTVSDGIRRTVVDTTYLFAPDTAGLAPSQRSFDVLKRSTMTLRWTLALSDGRTEDVTDSVETACSGGLRYDGGGVYTALMQGDAWAAASYAYRGVTLSDTVWGRVSLERAITAFTVSPGDGFRVFAGDTAAFTATAAYNDGLFADVTAAASWESTMAPAGRPGAYRPVEQGEAYVIAVYTEDDVTVTDTVRGFVAPPYPVDSSFGRPEVTLCVNDVPASGGQIGENLVASVSYRQEKTVTYSDGSTRVSYVTDGGFCQCSTGDYVKSLGTELRGRTKAGTLRYSVLLNGVTGEAVADVYQEENAFTSLSAAGTHMIYNRAVNPTYTVWCDAAYTSGATEQAAPHSLVSSAPGCIAVSGAVLTCVGAEGAEPDNERTVAVDVTYKTSTVLLLVDVLPELGELSYTGVTMLAVGATQPYTLDLWYWTSPSGYSSVSVTYGNISWVGSYAKMVQGVLYGDSMGSETATLTFSRYGYYESSVDVGVNVTAK